MSLSIHPPSLARVVDAAVSFLDQPFARPLVLSTGAIRELTEARATVRVEVAGQISTGRGSIYLSDLWAWPDAALSHAARDAALRKLAVELARDLPHIVGDAAHPLELGLQLHEHVSGQSEIPLLARAMVASPFDAAIHDAVGLALNRSAFALYREPARIPSADHLFQGGACRAIQSLLRTQPLTEFPAWLIVGSGDDLQRDLRPWISQRGYRCFKLKLHGKDNAADAARTAAVYRAARGMGVESPRLSVDSNEGNPDAASVLDYLERLEAADPDAYAALAYLEQPTARDIERAPFDWSSVARRKPVLLDEGLTRMDLLEEAVRQGWSGLALKTCKGHSFALVAAAWAKQRGLRLALQDLTNPGLALIHAALFAAFVPTINGGELNAPQFTPAANADYLPRLAPLMQPQDGLHRLPHPLPPGLGSRL